MAGTWSRYSKKAMAYEKITAMIQGFEFNSFRWAYQAKVIKVLDSVSRVIILMVLRSIGIEAEKDGFYFIII